MSCKKCKKNKRRTVTEQYINEPVSQGGTNTSSSGQYISGGAWDQKGEFFKSRRRTSKTEVKEVDITGGQGQNYKGFDKSLTIDDVPTDNIKPTNSIAPAYTAYNRYDDPNPYDNDIPDPYDPYDPDYPNGKKYPKTKPKKEWRSPPCCKPCKGGKWRHDCGELERAAGSQKSKSTGCIYATISDCQLAKKSMNEQTSSESSGQYDTPMAWEEGGILTTNTGTGMVGSEVLSTAPDIDELGDFDDVDITVISIEDLDMGPNTLGDLFNGGENMVDDEVDFSVNELMDDEEDEEDEFGTQLQESLINKEQNRIKILYNVKNPTKKRTLKESILDVRKNIRKIL